MFNYEPVIFTFLILHCSFFMFLNTNAKNKLCEHFMLAILELV
jgi:hypothetical protein